MKKQYKKHSDLPKCVPLFPLSGALLLPRGNIPLNIFEPRYLAMFNDSLGSERIIGMIQPIHTGEHNDEGPKLCDVGCLGRISAFQETDDGKYAINLTGICRFHIEEEITGKNGYRRANIIPFLSDLKEHYEEPIDRDLLLSTFKRFLNANSMETDWEIIEKTDDETLVTALCMMSPYGPAEKQALLEADDLKTRSETLVALTEIALAKNPNDSDSVLQ